jgi:beta-glucosidase
MPPRRLWRSKWLWGGVALLVVAACVLVAWGGAPADAGGPVYERAGAPVAARVKDLLGRMTLTEKIGQMDQIAVGSLQDTCDTNGGADLNEACMDDVLVQDKTGAIVSGGGMGPENIGPSDWADMVNTVQHYAVKNTRLHIPVLYGIDAVHGHNNVQGATLFPQEIGLGATWDPSLVRQTYASTSRAVGATGMDWDFAPVADLARDQRWGRYYETYGEDPLLAGTLAASAVHGLQDTHGAKRVAATVKHFAAYSEPSNGHDRVPADVSPRYLQDTLLPSYKAAIQAGADSVMVNSGAVNGVPATASHYLLTTVLRDQWHFQGVTVSDWGDVRNLQTAYHLAKDYPHAIALAVNAGVDMAMEPYNAADFVKSMRTAVNEHLVSVARIDQAVSRILTLKFRLGLFEHPYVSTGKANGRVLNADRSLARKAAAESQVLLANSGNTLPITAADRRIVVAGSYADDLKDQLGGWSVGWQGLPADSDEPGTTVLDGIRQDAPPGTTVVHARTAHDAVTQAKKADLVVVVVGEKAGAEGGADSPRPELSASQRSLVASLKATGTPVVEVVLAGRPLVLGQAAGTQGLLMSWLPGTEGGGVADVLFGKVNPSGRLPVTWPADLGNEPMYYQQLPGPNAGDESKGDALYEFGAGLSYTSYSFDSLTPARKSITPGQSLKVTVKVTNTGKRAGDLVVPVYVSRPDSGQVLSPARKLVAFTRVHLAAGQQRSVRLTVHPSALAVTPGDVDSHGPQRVEKGGYVLTAGDAIGVPFRVV